MTSGLVLFYWSLLARSFIFVLPVQLKPQLCYEPCHRLICSSLTGVGRVKIQTTSKKYQLYYTSKRLTRGLLSNDFFSQNSNLPTEVFLTFTRLVEMRQISCDIFTRFARFLYSTKQSWIIIILLLDVLMCSIAQNFYSLFAFSLALRARQNTAQLVKIPSDTTHQNV